tara:strand:- start:2678 stop:3667 length:990 start_codon:yes stop_codon:yes gene_type:complete
MNPVMLASDAIDFLNISLPGLHKQLKTKDLEFTKRQNRISFGHETARKIFKLKINPTCWSWQNLKGGVGKTHLSFATAVRLSLYGVKVAIIDLDQQGNATQACGIDAENHPILFDIIHNKLNIEECMVPVLPGLDILPSRIENAVLDNLIAINGLPVDKVLKKRIDALKKHYDIIFIDCPPSLGQTVTSASLAADHIIVPVDPERFSLSGLKVTLKELNSNVAEKYDTNLDISIILNKFDGRTGLSHTTLAALFNDEDYQKRLFKTFIRTSQELPNSVAKGKTIFDSLRSSTAKEDIDLLTREIIDRSLVTPMTDDVKVMEKSESLTIA